MNCNSEFHDVLRNMGEFNCPFCDELLQDYISVEKEAPCCENKELLSDNGMNVCQSCGVVHGYDLHHGYIDFHENKYKITRKSIYHRKYHIQNTITEICSKNNVQVTYENKPKIIKIFDEISQVNNRRKRMISIKFILRQVFEILGLPYHNIPISKSKGTLDSYEQYWKKIMSLIGDKIKTIIG